MGLPFFLLINFLLMRAGVIYQRPPLRSEEAVSGEPYT
jgi:hypothetical protein